MRVGPAEVLVILAMLAVGAIALGIPIWAVVDIVQRPEAVWRAAGRSRRAWLLGIVLTWIFGFGVVGFVASLVYLTGPRRELQRIQAS